MGYLAGNDLYRQLCRKIDGLAVRAPWNDQLCALPKELYTDEDAELTVKVPYGLASLERLEKVTGRPRRDRSAASRGHQPFQRAPPRPKGAAAEGSSSRAPGKEFLR